MRFTTSARGHFRRTTPGRFVVPSPVRRSGVRRRIERGSIVRETSVAVATARSSGTMKDRSRPVSSIMSTTAEMGPRVVAASTAAAPTTPNNPGCGRARGTTKHGRGCRPRAHPAPPWSSRPAGPSRLPTYQPALTGVCQEPENFFRSRSITSENDTSGRGAKRSPVACASRIRSIRKTLTSLRRRQ